MNDLLWRSVVHLCGISLKLNALLCLASMSWSGWETLSKMACNLDMLMLELSSGQKDFRHCWIIDSLIEDPVFITLC